MTGINKKLTERIMDRPFTIKDYGVYDRKKHCFVLVEGLKDIYIDVYEDFRIDAADAELGERQKEYLSVHYYDISKKLMELSGMSSDEIEVHLKKLKAEKVIDIEDFLREFKPKYKKLIYYFGSFVKRHHLRRWYEAATDYFPKKVLEESWKDFYTGGIYYEERFCYFRPEAYLYTIGKHDVVDPNEWTEFVNRNISYSTTDRGSRCYTLQDLDKAFEKFESSLGKVEESMENKLAENFANELKNLKKEGLFENIESFDLSFKNNQLNIKLNENTNIMPSAVELDELETKFYNLVGACEKYDYEYRSKYSNIYLVYMDCSGSYHDYQHKKSKMYVGKATEIENNAINGVSLDDLFAEGGRAFVNFTAYSLDEIEEALNGNGKLVGVICEYISQEADPEDVFMSKLKRNNFIKKFCDKYHLTPIFYIGVRGEAGEKWLDNWYDTFSELFNEYYDDPIENAYYDEITMTGPFGEEYES